MRRDLRIAVVSALLTILGIVAIVFHWRISGAILVILAVAAVSAYISLIVRPARLPRNSLLRIRLSGPLREYSSGPVASRLLGRNFLTLHHVRRALQAAQGASAISTVMVEISGLEVGMAIAQELNRLIDAVRASGKRTVAVLSADNVTAPEYLAACGAGEIVANPDAVFAMLGVAAGSLFVKGALDKLQVRAQTLQWKEYKGAAEMFSREKMSPELRESLSAIVDQRSAMLADFVARARKLDPAAARERVNGGFLSGRQALESGLVDRLGYSDDICAAYEPEGKRPRFVSIARMLRYAARNAPGRSADLIALVYGLGPVVAGEVNYPGEYIRAETTAAEIDAAARDSGIKAIVFRVSSPGGSPVGSDLVWRAVAEARRRGKPVVVSMGDVAGSGGYYVAMGADAIVAESSTITGSIGIVYMKLSFPELMARLGVNVETIKSAEVSDALSPYRPMSESELAQLNAVMAELYGNFTAKVAEGRKLAPEAVERVARGRIWSGEAAKAGGLVDSLGGLDRAIEIAREKAGIPAGRPHRIVPFTAPGGMFATNYEIVPAAFSWAADGVARVFGLPVCWIPALSRLAAGGSPLLLSGLF